MLREARGGDPLRAHGTRREFFGRAAESSVDVARALARLGGWRFRVRGGGGEVLSVRARRGVRLRFGGSLEARDDLGGGHALFDAVQGVEPERERAVELHGDVRDDPVEHVLVRRDRATNHAVSILDSPALQAHHRAKLRHQALPLVRVRGIRRKRRRSRHVRGRHLEMRRDANDPIPPRARPREVLT